MSDWSFKDWYKKNSRKLNRLRRRRYGTDPSYRERVLETNRKTRHKYQERRTKEKVKEREVIKTHTAKAWKESEIKILNHTTKLFTIGMLAKVVGRSVLSVRLWEKQGRIKKTPYTNSKGDRLYTAGMIASIRQALVDSGFLNSHKIKPHASPSGVLTKLRLSDASIVEELLFPVGDLAKVLGRAVITIDQMTRKGIFPDTPFKSAKVNRRFYTAEMMDAVKKAMTVCGEEIRGKEAKKKFHDYVIAEWTELKVIGSSIVDGDTDDGKENSQENLCSNGASERTSAQKPPSGEESQNDSAGDSGESGSPEGPRQAADAK